MKSLRSGFYIIFLFYFITVVYCVSHINTDEVIFYRSVALSGFHRILKYNVTLKGFNGETCILIEEKIPRDIYVDPYQLLQLIGKDKFKIVPDMLINTELPAYEAKSFNIQFCSSSKNGFHNIELPIHFRYQKPHQCNLFGETVHVNLGAPDVYIPPNSYDSSESNLICPPDTKDSWIKIPTAEFQTDFEIPVGCTEHLYPVLFSTISVIGLSAIYVCYVLIKTNKA